MPYLSACLCVYQSSDATPQTTAEFLLHILKKKLTQLHYFPL